MARVVWETETRICGWASIRALTRLVLPAPEGAEMMYRVPVLWVMSGLALLNVLHLFAHLLDQHLEVDRGLGAARIEGFGAQCVGFAVELLHQEVQPAPGLPAGLEYTAHFSDV